ncbi:hypothetical protein K8R03_03305 [Candidatus Kaiserbacteria bacterium]|nr:hypothetical protein [Candidatus Kaiserbacteria bacterium]
MFRNYSTSIMPIPHRISLVTIALSLLLVPTCGLALTVSGPTLKLSTGSYFSWGAAGFSGYGIRDNAGTLEFKNAGGSWASLEGVISNFCASGGCGGGSSVAWANITGKPYPINGQTWNWNGQSGQPTWLWGSNDGTNMYVWNPSNFIVNYANSAGSVPWSSVSGKTGTYSGSSFNYCGQYMSYSGGLATGLNGSYNCGGADVAERYYVDGAIPVERGYIVSLSDATMSTHLSVTNPAVDESTATPYDMTTAKVHVAVPGERERVIGAVPTRAFDIAQDSEYPAGTQLVALVGHVPIHVTLENGPIVIGDPITLSASKAGFGMKARTPGRIVGYALAAYSIEGGGERATDMIEVFIHLESWHPTDAVCASDATGETCITKAALDSLLKLLQ